MSAWHVATLQVSGSITIAAAAKKSRIGGEKRVVIEPPYSLNSNAAADAAHCQNYQA
jgi:hypothetical protein